MRHADVAIIGGGLAGSLAAAMLGRAGVPTILVDPNAVYPPDFRCEKLDGAQVRVLEKTGLAQAILRATTPDHEVWVARMGRLVDKRSSDQNGIYYASLVNTVRGEIPSNVSFMQSKAAYVATGTDRQTVMLESGQAISTRLVVIASGLHNGLRESLGITREVISKCHSVTIGFDIKPAGRSAFAFGALTHYAERVQDQTALLSLFPIDGVMRANLFVYRDLRDPWLQRMRTAPQDTLFALMPGLRALTGDFHVISPVKIRAADLYITNGHRQAGMVLVGDAYATSCPAAGTGALKVLTDVERLCNVHIPHWLKSPGMPETNLAEFYDDPVKKACDDFSLAKAFQLRSFSTDPSLAWSGRRWAKFIAHSGLGTLRKWNQWLRPAQRAPRSLASAAVAGDKQVRRG